MTTTDPTAPAFDGTRRSMREMWLYPFEQWWSALPIEVQVALVLAFVMAMIVVVWWAVRHDRRHAPTSKRHQEPGPGQSTSPGLE